MYIALFTERGKKILLVTGVKLGVFFGLDGHLQVIECPLACGQ